MFKERIYRHMIKRCYSKNNNMYNSYGKKGVTVCDRWINNIDIFKNDLSNLFQYEKFYRYPTIYQIDKDYKQFNLETSQKIYSPETCIFLHKMDNNNLMTLSRDIILEGIPGRRYYGVSKRGNIFRVEFIVCGNKLYFGSFENEDIAACVYNYWYNKIHPYELVPILNNTPVNIPPEKFGEFNLDIKLLYKVIDNSTPPNIIQIL